MEISKLKQSIKNIKTHGDAARIAKMVNKVREKNNQEKISPAYIRSMLNGNRKMTDEVAEIAEKYFKAQELIMNLS